MKTVWMSDYYEFRNVGKSALQSYESMDAKEAFMYINPVK